MHPAQQEPFSMNVTAILRIYQRLLREVMEEL
jgi:hypothetical protein